MAESTSCDENIESFGWCVMQHSVGSGHGTITACGACLRGEEEQIHKRQAVTRSDICEGIDECFGEKCPEECKPDLMNYIECQLEEADLNGGEISCP